MNVDELLRDAFDVDAISTITIDEAAAWRSIEARLRSHSTSGRRRVVAVVATAVAAAVVAFAVLVGTGGEHVRTTPGSSRTKAHALPSTFRLIDEAGPDGFEIRTVATRSGAVHDQTLRTSDGERLDHVRLPNGTGYQSVEDYDARAGLALVAMVDQSQAGTLSMALVPLEKPGRPPQDAYSFGYGAHGAISPDGSELVIGRSLSREIEIRKASTPSVVERRITDLADGWTESLTWTQSGIVAMRTVNEPNGLRLNQIVHIDPRTWAVTTIATSAHEADWAGAFMVDGHVLVTQYGALEPHGVLDIDVAHGTRRLTPVKWFGGMDLDPSGRWLLMSRADLHHVEFVEIRDARTMRVVKTFRLHYVHGAMW